MSARHAYALMVLLLITPQLPTVARWLLVAIPAALWLLTFDEHDQGDDVSALVALRRAQGGTNAN